MRKIELTGERFGMWTILKYSKEVSMRHGSRYYLGECDCGVRKYISSTSLMRGQSKSCGCVNAIKASERLWKHGKSRTRTYYIWKGMIYRCRTHMKDKYKNYAARGITVCERWFKYENFLEDMGECPENFSIDRIDNNKGYFKENCRWADRLTQANNRRGVRQIEFNGEVHSIAEWARKFRIPRPNLNSKLRRGMTMQEIHADLYS